MTEPAVRTGDVVVVEAKRVGDGRRLGEILDVTGTPGHLHYRIRWEDGHESVLYPGGDVSVRRADAVRKA